MILTWLLLIPLIGGVIAWVTGRSAPVLARWTSLAALVIDTALLLGYVMAVWEFSELGSTSGWWVETSIPWIPSLGISFLLAMDGLSFVLIVLTLLLGILSVICSWNEIDHQVGFFHFNLLWILSGIIGVFLALDLFLFYFFWELMLIPMYFLIAIWGHENRYYAAMKFFIYTQLSGLLMLAAIVALYFLNGQSTGVYSYDYRDMIGLDLPLSTATLLMWGFLAAFLVKLPAFPVHNWLPDAHTQAPTAGSVILAGLLLKTGAYGLIRFVMALFPEATIEVTPIMMLIGAVGIIYGAVLAFAQHDLKRLVAYTSVSHMGFILLGVFAHNELGMQGTVMQMICHGISTGALFILVGFLYERLHTRDLRKMGGLWQAMPQMGAVAMLFAMASLGLPGLGNFVAEMTMLFGAFQTNITMTVIATFGLVAATIYSLWILQRGFMGPIYEKQTLPDLSSREWGIMIPLIAIIVWLGLFPQPVFDLVAPGLQQSLPSVESIQTSMNDSAQLTQIEMTTEQLGVSQLEVPRDSQ